MGVPDGECPGSGAMPPSVRKPSLAIRRGCLGVPYPPAAAPRLRVSVWPVSFARGLLRSVWRGPPSDALRPTAARASPHRVGGGSRTGPGPASPARFCGRVVVGRVRCLTSRGIVRWWGGAAPPPPSPRRAALRPLPSRAAAGGRRAGTGRCRLAPGVSRSPGLWVSRAATGRLEREKTDAVGGVPLGGAGAPGGGGRASGQARGRVAEAGRRPGRRGAALVCGGGIPARFPGGPPASSALPRGPPAARPCPFLAGSRLVRGLFYAAADSLLRVRELTEAGLPPRGCRPRPLHWGGWWLPRRGAPRTR